MLVASATSEPFYFPDLALEERGRPAAMSPDLLGGDDGPVTPDPATNRTETLGGRLSVHCRRVPEPSCRDPERPFKAAPRSSDLNATLNSRDP